MPARSLIRREAAALPKSLLTPVLLAFLSWADPNVAVGALNFNTLHGTWRWLDTVGDLLPALGTPQTCDCARLLILQPGGTYEYFWPDSSGGYLLTQGGVSVTKVADLADGDRVLGDVRLSFAPSFDSKRHSLPSDGLARTIARDTFLLISAGTGSPPSHVTRRFVREPSFTGKVPAPRAEVPVRRKPSASQRDSLSIPPASATPRPYGDPPIPVLWIESDAAHWLKGNTMAGDVRVKALVAAAERVKDAEVAGLDPRIAEPCSRQ